ncbi:hypothetical protein FNO01nite_30300 [Flavobacterium noncentrifugens]|uniref:Uncharacterized protein n=1 Tax=Flavobacterium noncentrifugens TaxID=1128970 RepID=A0A1G9BT23_9FLAO|nr:hypothetical protein [Flavobacterium noncentrifugens]GEP52358.1 hypothetical protein FNO01nite_30300 [Flavobacterium noncentrifugens]SDK42641.1 hypothetical protein SAMN04487935_3343 [Flavobacterium noncentrifugens]
MIKFIDLTDRLRNGVTAFAFLDMNKDTFKVFSGTSVWPNIEKFAKDFEGDDLQWYISLIPPLFPTLMPPVGSPSELDRRIIGAEIKMSLHEKDIFAIRSMIFKLPVKEFDIEELKRQLQAAEEIEDYEQCKILIDKINNFKQ